MPMSASKTDFFKALGLDFNNARHEWLYRQMTVSIPPSAGKAPWSRVKQATGRGCISVGAVGLKSGKP